MDSNLINVARGALEKLHRLTANAAMRHTTVETVVEKEGLETSNLMYKINE